MKSENKNDIQKAFTSQAKHFETSHMGLSKNDSMDYAVKQISPVKTDRVLEIAAGTCVTGRSLAPFVQSVACLDMTPAMLSVGKAEAEKSGLGNMTFILGDAAELPFLDCSFDIVVCRLAFHHFPSVEKPFDEMARVLSPGGRLVIIDMEAPGEELRVRRDEIEKMRDFSHIHNLSREEFISMYENHGLTVSLCETAAIPVRLESWFDITDTPEDMRKNIRSIFSAEVNGGEKTGFDPYIENSDIKFRQNWILLKGTAPEKA